MHSGSGAVDIYNNGANRENIAQMVGDALGVEDNVAGAQRDF